MVDTHGARFDGRIWDAFDNEIVPELPGEPRIVDLGCGPGLFLYDIHQRLPDSKLFGVDASPAMLEVADNLGWSSVSPRLEKMVLGETLPFGNATMDVVAMNFFLHQFDYPLPLMAEVSRTLKPDGFVWIYDWARKPLEEYLNFWNVEPELPDFPVDRPTAYKLFGLHNRFSREDWRYLLAQAGFKVAREVSRASGQHRLMILKRKTEVALG
jgi:SAM-dependent methyltransferase